MKGFPQGGPKDWTPNKVGQILSGLEDLTVDIGAEDLFPGHPFLSVAQPLEKSQTYLAYHVTDDPSRVSQVLAQGGDLGAHHRGNGKCGGLYVSLTPHQWRQRSGKRWEFLAEMTRKEKKALSEVLLAELYASKKTGYISKSEYDQAARAIWNWRDEAPHAAADSIRFIAGQPWNMDIVGMARHLKIADPFKPYAVSVVFTGRYLEYTNEAQRHLITLAQLYFKRGELENISEEDLCETLRHYGWDGLYEPSRSGAPGQVLIWNADKIVSFGAPEVSARLSGREGATIHEGHRFETGLSPSGQKAIIQEVADHHNMFGPMSSHHVQELRDMLERIRTGLPVEQGRFKADLSKDLPEIVDTQIYRRIKTISPDNLAEMIFLLDDLVGQMGPA